MLQSPNHHPGKIPLNRPVYIKLIAQIAALPYQVVCAVVKGLDFRIRVSTQKGGNTDFFQTRQINPPDLRQQHRLHLQLRHRRNEIKRFVQTVGQVEKIRPLRLILYLIEIIIVFFIPVFRHQHHIKPLPRMLRHNPFCHLHLQYGIAENQIDGFPLFIEEFVLQQGNRVPFPLIYPVKRIKYPEAKNNQAQHGQTDFFQPHIPKNSIPTN